MGIYLPPLVDIGLTDQPKSGDANAMAPLAPPAPTGLGREVERESKGEVTKNIPLTEDLFSTSQPGLYHIVLIPLKTSINETYKNSIHLLLHASKHNLGSILSTVWTMEQLAPPTLNVPSIPYYSSNFCIFM